MPPTTSASSAAGVAGLGLNSLNRLCDSIFQIFQSVQLAIILLSCLAVGIMVGVFVPQESLTELAQIKQQFGEWFWPLRALGAFTVYSSYWFLTLQVLFFFNLLAGSFKWLRPAVLAALHKQALPLAALKKAQPAWVWQTPSHITPAMISQGLRKRGYKPVAQTPEGSQYWTKGSWTRFGPAVAHIGILSMLMASVWGAFNGFKAQKAAVPGQQFTLAQADTFTTGVPKSMWWGKTPNWSIKVTDFKVDVYADNPQTVKQYYCALDVLNPQGQRLKSQVISVNHPLQMGDVMVYQASFAPTGKLKLRINGNPVTLNANDQMQERPVAHFALPHSKQSLLVFPFFVQQDPGVAKTYMVAFLRENNQFVGQVKGKMPPNLKLLEGQAGRLGPWQLQFDRAELMTGLQIKSAPETAWIYASFFVICLGTVICFFSQRRLWTATETLADGTHRVYVLPRTNKGKIGFQKELLALDSWLVAQSAQRIKQGGPLAL
jgi:cytochrome c biogenesis protein